MEAEGILTGFHASVDPIQLGYHIKAYISLEISPAQKPEVYPFLRAHPNVLECDCVTGNYSVLLKVAFPSTMELDEFIAGCPSRRTRWGTFSFIICATFLLIIISLYSS